MNNHNIPKLNICVFVFCIVFSIINPCYGVTVNGYCYLDGQSVHDWIMIVFEADFGTAHDTVFTNASGYFSSDRISGQTGYSVEYSFDGYGVYTLRNQYFISLTTLDPVALLELPQGVSLNGDISGTLEDTSYIINGDLNVPLNDTLTIAAGAVFLINGYYVINIDGCIIAEGNEDEEIVFQTVPGGSVWKGIKIEYNEEPSNNVFRRCAVKNSDDTGLIVTSGSALVESCVFTGNSGLSGGGVKIGGEGSSIASCEFSGNSGLHGGGIYCTGTVQISDCDIFQNTASAGGGIYTSGYDGMIEYCRIYENESSSGGGGIRFDNNSDPVLEYCQIYDNTSSHGGAVQCEFYSSPQIGYCTIAGNIADQMSGSAMFIHGFSYPDISNTIFACNTGESCLQFSGAENSTISYCDFFANGVNFGGGSIPAGLGPIVQTNYNGDPCDIYNNIYLDPLFADYSSADFHLTEDSPCIDAGDPSSPLDPDSTIADIGVYYFAHQGEVRDPLPIQPPVNCCLYPPYPNPFNSSVEISFRLTSASPLELVIYNLQGREIAVLADEVYLPGSHHLRYSPEKSLPSGIYFACLTTPKSASARKLILLK